jgi:hypothetical protein
MHTEITTVKELPIEFVGTGEVRRFLFRQVTKSDKGYVYEVKDGDSVHYEVFRRKINQFGGVSYPKSKSFGVWAWSTKSLVKAMEYYNEA